MGGLMCILISHRAAEVLFGSRRLAIAQGAVKSKAPKSDDRGGERIC
jgi:hypothetical protein